MSALIFGSNSQDGFYLKKLLGKQLIRCISVSKQNADIQGNVADFAFVSDLIKNEHPVYIFHFAAESTTQYHALFHNHEAIATGTLNILDAVKKYSPNTKVFITGSAVQFKNTGTPINENSEFEALNPYAIARIQSVYAARYYRSLGINTYVGYLFHHESPLRKPNHISKKITDTLNRIKSGSSEKLEIGDVTVKKEWTFAGDTVNAVWTLVNQDEVFEAVIGSGITYAISDWINTCCKILQLNYNDVLETNPDFIPEYATLVSNPALIKSLGWRPLVGFTDLAEMMIYSEL